MPMSNGRAHTRTEGSGGAGRHASLLWVGVEDFGRGLLQAQGWKAW